MSLLLSDGSFQGKIFWKNEENDMLAFYNGNEQEAVTQVSATVPRLRFLYGEGEAALSDGIISGWEFRHGDWGNTFFLPDETYAGGGALGIKTDGNAHATQRVKSLTGGEVYTLKARLKVKAGSAAIKTEFFQNNQYYQGGSISFVGTQNGEWNEISYTFTVPEGADSADILLRVIGGGEAYWDDVRLFRGDTEKPLQNPGFETVTGGILTVYVPPKTLMMFGSVHNTTNILEKHNIVYEKPVSGAVVRCDSDTWVSQDIRTSGKKEMIGFFVNGDILRMEIGELSFYRWDHLQPK